MLHHGAGWMRTIRPLCCLRPKTKIKNNGAKMQKKTLTKTAKNGARKPAAKITREKTKAANAAIPPTREQIARRAYEIYAGRGTGGRELEDWVQAERELLAEALRNN
jgi:hypothetical protein